MRFTVYSKFHEECRKLAGPCQGWGGVYKICRFLAAVVSLLAELGLLLSAVSIPLLPFLVLGRFRIGPPEWLYWLCTTALLLCLLGLLCVTGRKMLFFLRQRRLDIEMAVMLGGFCITLFLVVTRLPVGWSKL